VETLKSIFRFYVNSSIHVALAICALISITLMKLGADHVSSFLFFNYVGSIAAYNFVKYSNVSKLYHKRLAKSMKGIQALTWISLFLFLFYAIKVPTKTLLYMFPFLVLTVLYVAPVFPNENNLRNIAGVKIFIIALVWTGITVVVPTVYAEMNMNLDFVIECVQRFLFIIVMMLPFEIRDLKFDASELEQEPRYLEVFY